MTGPLARVGCVGGPDADCLVLRGRCDVGLGQDAGRPGDVAHPVRVALQGLSQVVRFGFRAARTMSANISRAKFLSQIRQTPQKSANVLVVPDLDQIVASTRHKPSLLSRSRVGADQATGKRGGSPADGIDSHAVGMEDLVSPAVIAKLEDTDMAVGGGAGQKTATLMWGPRHHVDRGCVEGEIEDLGPCAAADRRGRVLGLLAPDQDLAVVGRRREDCTILGMCLEAEESAKLRRADGGAGA